MLRKSALNAEARIRTEYRPENFEYEYFSCNENLVLL